jgi:hypothetical protein
MVLTFLRMMGCLMFADATTPYIIAMFIKICVA